ncbi:CPBP family intramembrane glutamic endopeptidase [Lentilactobacillus farraginis]|uniref:CAAX amino terminal protease family protein n=1 Tax=Lentilactobacillus farraginis DSM 18382 = JCM 14108 TaxID=1423743 RepID=A0A0R1VNL1_9LACO|nr:CPBP family intramembrane glutamic endopeptidase [Lentilactobacillus farraginis]KRM03276.1 CAAX amino terminal protease family protein [Lentilactobacillus farraginis DSM 18382 = JCM 14108]
MATLTPRFTHSVSLIFKIQCTLIIAILSGSLLINAQFTMAQFGSWGNLVILFGIPIIGLIIPSLNHTANESFLPKGIKICLRLLITSFYPNLVFLSIAFLLHPLIEQSRSAKMPIIYLAFLIAVISLIPYIKIIIIDETGPIARMLIIFAYLYFFPTTSYRLGVLGFNPYYADQIAIKFNGTSILAIISYLFLFATTGYVMHQWRFNLPKFKINSKIHVTWLFIICLVACLELNATAASWHNIFYHFDWQPVSGPLAYFVMIVISVCCYEEFIFRYAIFWQLLRFKHPNNKAQILEPILISSLLFGLWHLSNLNHQSLPATLLQLIGAIGTGFILATITLYTGTIWISIVLHSLMDLVGFPEITSAFSQAPTTFETEYMLLIALLEIGISLLLLLAKRPQAAFQQTMVHLQAK